MMAWADTLAGLCIANAGVTLPHGIGMTIGGQCPQVMHGEALAVTYPEFTRFTYPCASNASPPSGASSTPSWSSFRRVAARKNPRAVDQFLKRIGCG